MNESHPIKMSREDVLYNSSLVTDLANMFNKGTLPIHAGVREQEAAYNYGDMNNLRRKQWLLSK